MWFAAALMVWAADPVLRSPEERLPIGAVARLGEARFTRPVRSSETIEFTPDGRQFCFLSSGVGSSRTPNEWWDTATLKRIPPPFRLNPDERIQSISPAGIICSTDSRFVLRDPTNGQARFVVQRTDALPFFNTPTFATSGDLAFSRTNSSEAILFRKAKDGSCLSNVLKDVKFESVIRMSANGSTIVWNTETEINRYDTTTGQTRTIRKLVEPFVIVNSLEVSPDGRSIFICVRDRNYDQPPESNLFVGDDPKPITLSEPKHDADQVNYNRIQFSDDGRTLYCMNYRSCFGWSSQTGESLWSYTAVRISESALSPDGRLLVYQEPEGCFRVVDVTTGIERTPRVKRLGGFTLASWIDSATVIATSAGAIDANTVETPGVLVRWNPLTNSPPERLPLAERGNWSAESLSSDGRLVAMSRRTSDGTQTFRIREIGSNRTVSEWESASSDSGFIGPFTGDHRRVVLRKDRQSAVFTVESLRPLVTFSTVRTTRRRDEMGWPGRQILITPDQRLLITPNYESAIAAYELATGQLRYATTILGSDNRRGDPSGRVSLAISGNGRRLAIELSGQIMLVDPMTGKLDRVVSFNTRRRNQDFTPIALSQSGRWLAVIRPDEMDIAIHDLDAERTQPERIFRGATGTIQTLAFAPDDRHVLSTSSDGTGITWELTNLLNVHRTPEENVERWWDDLSKDAATAAAAMNGLVHRQPARAVGIVRRNWVRPADTDPARIKKAILDLDANDYPVRESAQAFLREAVEFSEGDLIATAKRAKSAEVRMQASSILDNLDGPDRNEDRVRWVRAVEVLERIGSDDAKSVLTLVAGGPPPLRVTKAAKAALERLAKMKQ